MESSEVRQRLEHELRATKGRLHDQSWPLNAALDETGIGGNGPAGDVFDRIEHTESREQSLDARERLMERVDRILDAVQRLDDGSYGICVACGGEIGVGRLHAIPEVATCRGCQEHLEMTQPRPVATRLFMIQPRHAADEDE